MPECLTKCYTNHTILGETSSVLKTTNEEKRIHIKDINFPYPWPPPQKNKKLNNKR